MSTQLTKDDAADAPGAGAPAAPALLELRELHVFYGAIEALKGVELSVAEGRSSRCWVPMVRASRRR